MRFNVAQFHTISAAGTLEYVRNIGTESGMVVDSAADCYGVGRFSAASAVCFER